MPNPTAPGVYTTIASAAPSPALQANTGQWFVTGETQSGPINVATPLGSMTDYLNFCGTRPGFTTLYDSLDEFFRDGGSQAWVSRVASPTAVSALLALKDTAATPVNTLTVTANGGGAWGNSTTVQVSTGTVTNTYVLTIVNTISGQTWVSPNLYTPADAVTWATNLAGTTPWAFPYTITNDASATTPPGNNPAVLAATNLATGVDNISGVTETQWTTALTAFDPHYGPGQVSAPGHTTAAGYQALNTHASAVDSAGALVNNRFALLDDADSGTAATVSAQVAGAQLSVDNGFAMLFAPWVIIPGIPATSVGGSPVASTRTIPPSAYVAARMASSDASNNSGMPAAGSGSASQYAIGLTQTYVESDRGLLNTAGVSVIRVINGSVQLYGYQTIATNPAWVSASNSRMRMELVNALNNVAQPFAFQQIDGQGHLLSHFNGVLSGVCQNYWAQGALYGTTPAQAYQVNTGSVVNTPTTLAAGQLNATVSVRFSPYAEFVQISVVSYPVTASLPGV